jgi:NAD(P)-dependent dehydrogenase (short-subunit alcohol dehydrogenase family)
MACSILHRLFRVDGIGVNPTVMINGANSTSDLNGKVCLVTGATSGIGEATAKALAARGAQVILVGRNQLKADKTVQQIQSETGSNSVQYLLADFADLQQIHDLVSSFKSQYSRLDVLINNAGAYFNSRRQTAYGVEMTFLVNHLAPFLLTNLLLDMIKASPAARIINVSSDAHQYGSMDFADLEYKRRYFGMKAYARSKLANIMFTYELARRLEGSAVTVNALHPGHIATDIWRTNFSLIGPLLKWIMGFFAITPEEGAKTSIYLASSPEVEGLTGQYYVKREVVQSSPMSYDQNLARQLWRVSEQLSGQAASS